MDSQEEILLPLRYSIACLPQERCKAFYAKKWQSWEKEQPEWFDEEFKESVPRELPPM